jgi:hypothetical protein
MMPGWVKRILIAGASIAAAGFCGCGTGVISDAVKPAMVAAARLQDVVMHTHD